VEDSLSRCRQTDEPITNFNVGDPMVWNSKWSLQPHLCKHILFHSKLPCGLYFQSCSRDVLEKREGVGYTEPVKIKQPRKKPTSRAVLMAKISERDRAIETLQARVVDLEQELTALRLERAR
jgi:hypothetical protein